MTSLKYNLISIILGAFIAFSSANCFASQINLDDISHTLVLDSLDSSELPERFRTSSFFPNKKTNFKEPNLNGLPELHISGSGQFSEHQLLNALEYMPHNNVIIVDLRKESHGFVNGTPVSWYISRNAINDNRTPEQVLKFEHELLENFKNQETIKISKLEKIKNLPKPPKVIYRDTKPVKVELVEKEQELAKRYNLKYVRFFIPDNRAPDSGQVDAFINLVKNLPEDAWLYFHCRGGSGRSTTFMAMYDIMKNAPKVNLKDILYRQAYLGGKNLYKMPSDLNNWKYKYQKMRFSFLQKFYQYVVETQERQGLRWSEWLESKVADKKI